MAQVTACVGYMRTRAPLRPSGGTRSDFSGRLKHGFFTANLPGTGIHRPGKAGDHARENTLPAA